jgi:hypothetical protein
MAVRAGVAASCRSAVSISTGPTISGNARTRPATSCPQRRPASVDRSTSAAARSAPRTSSIRRRRPQCGEQRDLHCGVGEVDGGDSPPGYVDDVDRHQAAGTSGGNGLDLRCGAVRRSGSHEARAHRSHEQTDCLHEPPFPLGSCHGLEGTA